ncbi:tegument protein UL88 [Common bottlenose dolphin gammaherpesvirus 1 strain Sarasota]|uniref:Tegument protein UL88 n=1 Tax=Common bottlenose dolphin gammaherpesvirus 1 strain Sarasota TaxID=2022783 RepID=A0A1Z1NE16_9GAMA|nr:tegument protein UL88 [Common bottlenose dolphin gammaherpesvirus 1 strain Sarasota]ARW78086.1 tegument protein UL88 [Common bottlenose dolphin gammaherpesvirus 1 strain Sarasota]
MLKIKHPGASLSRGMVRLGNGRIVFHMINSRELAALLGWPGPCVPAPLLFTRFFPTATDYVPLYLDREPLVSMVRLILSPHPLILKSFLVVGFHQTNGAPVLLSRPIVRSRHFADAEIKVSSSLMSCTKTDFSDAVIFDDGAHGDVENVCAWRRVAIREELNHQVEFLKHEPVVKIWSGLPKPGLRAQGAPKPILKKSRGGQEAPNIDAAGPQAKLFYAIRNHVPSLTQSTAHAFNTVRIMSQSNNSVWLFPEGNLSSVQNLYVKHVILRRLGLENAAGDLETLYLPHATGGDLIAAEISAFEAIVGQSLRRAEDIIFCLDFIGQSNLPYLVKREARQRPIRLALEKYFLMFPPRNRENAVLFGVVVVNFLCRGVSLSKVAKFLQRYMDVPARPKNTNLLKMYALLTI